MNRICTKTESGFALLLTLVVVSVVLAIGLSLVDISLKQLVISGTGRDSETAFHAAYAGAECGQYWRLQKIDEFIDGVSGNPPNISPCLPNESFESSSFDDSLAGGDVSLSQYQITWGDAGDRCTELDVYIYDASAGAVTYDVTYYGEGSETCSDGSTCTLMFSRGYNRACDNISSIGVIQREVVLEY